MDYGVGAYDQTVEGGTTYATSSAATLSGLSPGSTVKYRITATGTAPVGSQPVDLATWVLGLPPYSVSTVELR